MLTLVGLTNPRTRNFIHDDTDGTEGCKHLRVWNTNSKFICPYSEVTTIAPNQITPKTSCIIFFAGGAYVIDFGLG